MKYYLYNSRANNGIRPAAAEGLELTDAVGLDYPAFFAGLQPEDEVVLIGGDGTINYFINAVDTDTLKNRVWFLGAGTGNDFLNDIERKAGEEILLNEYLTGLPTVYVNGMERRFINGIGYGIDGYCCEVADQIKEKSPNEKIDYTAIAIKGLLFHFKPRCAEVTVDGRRVSSKNVWIAATMKGRFYGGGMMIAPAQKRSAQTVSLVQYKTGSKLRALINFPSIFKGEHIKKTGLVQILEGREIEVRFDRPCALQIDGETVLNVSSYRVKA